MEIRTCSVGTAELAYQVFGNGRVELVIEMGLGAVMAEWQPLARQLGEGHTVLLYERAGYGSSGVSTLERTPAHIAAELHGLLETLDHAERVTLLAHSQGGLYAQKFARMYPELVERLVLLDPLSPEDSRFRRELTPAAFRKSGADKTAGLRLNLRLARLHLGWILRRVMRTAPPFYYDSSFSPEETAYILDAVSRARTYETALAEYAAAHEPQNLEGLTEPSGFPSVPLVLVTHDSAIEEQEISTFGGASEAEARKIEALWQMLMRGYLDLSPRSRWVRAPHSSHYIHLTDRDLVCALLSGDGTEEQGMEEKQ